MEELKSAAINLQVSESKSGSYQVTKSNKLIESQYELSANQQKLLSACISQVNPKRKYSEEEGGKVAFSFTFSREDVMRLVKIESKHLSPFLEEASKKFQGLHAHQFDDSSGERTFELVNLIEKCAFDGKNFFVLFTATASKELYDLKKVGYTKYLLENIQELTSQYAIRLYELIQRVMNPRLQKQNCSFMLNDLYFFLGIINFRGEPIVKSAAKTFSNFYNDILLVAIDQINERTELEIELIEKKRIGRKIGKLVFKVNRTASLTMIEHDSSTLVGKLIANQIEPTISEEWCEKFEPETIEKNLALMIQQEKHGKKIKNKTGYLSFLLSNNIADLPDIANPYSSLYSNDKAAQEFVKIALMPVWYELSEEWQKDLINNGIQASRLGPEFSRWKSEYIINSVNADEYREIAKALGSGKK